MDTENNAFNYISRQDINNFPFPYKLWLIVNLEMCDFSKWNIDGTELEIDIIGLDGYLNSPQSIFKIKTRSVFIDHLRGYGFEVVKSNCGERVPKDGNESSAQVNYSNGIVMRYKHEHFRRHRIDLLAKVRRVHDVISVVANGSKRKNADLCFTSFGTLSKIQMARIKQQTILKFQKETKILQEKLLASELLSKLEGQKEAEDDIMIELPADLFENPHDSVLYMGDEHRTAYAGYYGNCTNEQIVKFFGDYLPRYDYVGNETVDGESLDLNPTDIAASSTPIDIESKIAEAADLAPEPSPSPAASSSLQPIFAPDNDEEDISMDELIKFKEQAADTQPAPANEVKMEVANDEEEDNDNEANFKNFFNQYRESLSLLYEKQ